MTSASRSCLFALLVSAALSITLTSRVRAEAAEPESVALELPRPNQGYYLSLGISGGVAKAWDAQRDPRKPTWGPGLVLGYGQALTPWLSLGLGMGIMNTGGDPNDSLSLFRMGLDSRWHVTPHWFLDAGFGVGTSQGQDPESASLTRDRYGDLYHLGVGTELFLTDASQSGGWTLSPLIRAEVGPERPITTGAVYLGLQLSWWLGLPSRQLDLPIDKAYD